MGRRLTEEFIRHRLTEYEYSFATLCRICSRWEIGIKRVCGNTDCDAIEKDVVVLSPRWSDRQAEIDKSEAMCKECKAIYVTCSCEWKRKYVMWAKYEKSLEKAKMLVLQQ